jgi:RimJ/RimL family protein N-acetyltransferase
VDEVVTERLTLVPLTRAEAAAVAALARDRAARPWAVDYPTEGDLVVAGIVGEAGTAYDEQAPLGPRQLVLTATGEVVGGAGFLFPPDADGSVEIGYGLAESVRGLGLATEAVQALVARAAEHGALAVVALTTPDNAPSQRVLARCGFVRDGEVPAEDGSPMWRWVRAV